MSILHVKCSCLTGVRGSALQLVAFATPACLCLLVLLVLANTSVYAHLSVRVVFRCGAATDAGLLTSSVL